MTEQTDATGFVGERPGGASTVARSPETHRRRAWDFLCELAGFVVGVSIIAAIRSDGPDEYWLNVGLQLVGGLGGATLAYIAAERRLPSMPRWPWSRGEKWPSYERGLAWLLTSTAVGAVMLGATGTYEWPEPVQDLSRFIVLGTSWAFGVGIVELWAMTHPAGKVASL